MKIKKLELGSLIGATLLVAGTSIGGGMLALPVTTCRGGFFPSLLLLLICWVFMTSTGLLMLEVNLWMKEKDAHVISMSSRFLGPLGKAIAWITYLFIGYASLVAYIAGGGALLQEAFNAITGLNFETWACALIFICIFGFIIDLGAKLVGKINAILVASMVIAYIFLVGFGIKEIKPDLLFHSKWCDLVGATPIVLTVFSFQCIVPSLTIYLKRDIRALRIAIIAGTLITCLVYIIWELLILGTVPLEGNNSLTHALLKGEPATDFYKLAVNNSLVSLFAGFFAFFALATSFLGLGLGLFDFLADGLKLEKKGKNKIVLALIIIIPSLFFALVYERAFLVALDTSGGFGDAILNGILPVLMVFVGRYWMKQKGEFTFPGGKWSLGVIILFYIGVLALEVYQLLVR
jgi:tyrosine-specific transport protein